MIQKRNNEGVACCWVVLAVVVLLVVLLCGCTTERTITKEVPIVTTNTIERERAKVVRDTLIYKDSVFVYQKGDTLVEKYYTTFHHHTNQLDTIVMRDSIQVPFEVKTIETKEVERKKTKGEKTLEVCGWLFLGTLLGSVVFVAIKIRNRFT